MNTTAPPLELHAIEKLREEQLEEAHAIQGVMLPSESVRAGAVTISYEFQPPTAVGGDFFVIESRLWHVLTRACREWAKGPPVCVDRSGALQ
jgi:hypothetical protein